MHKKALASATKLFAPLLVVLLWSISAMAKPESSEEIKVRSLVGHTHEEQFAKEAAERKEIKFPRAEAGKRFLDVYPLAQIEALEAAGDEIRLPSAVVAELIHNGTFVNDYAPLAVQKAPELRVGLKNKQSIVFHLIFDPGDQSFAYAESPIGVLVMPQDMRCRYDLPKVQKGMTRADLTKLVHVDGGICAPFTYERKVLNSQPKRTDDYVIKMNFALKPDGMSEAVYLLGKWQRPKESEKDTVMRFSPPYLERQFHD